MSDAPATISHYPRARLWLGLSVVIAVLGMACSVLWVVWRLVAVDDAVESLSRFGADGTGDVTLVVDEPVDWTIYLEPSSRSLSGVRFSIIDAESQQPAALTTARNGVDYSVGEHTGRPISRAPLDAGTYEVEVSPDDVTLAIGDDLADQVQLMWLGAFLIGLPTVVGGGIIAGVNGIRVMRSSTPPPTDGDDDPS